MDWREVKRLNRYSTDHPGGPVVKTPHPHCRGNGFSPFLGHLESHMPQSQKKKKGEILKVDNNLGKGEKMGKDA